MKNLLMLAIAVVLALGGVAGLKTRNDQSQSTRGFVDAKQANNAAYRDGLFLGSFAARRGDDFHSAAGRWARDEDRDAFTAGYRDGYNAVLAERGGQSLGVR